MADRPRNGGPGEHDPEFGWLYGKKNPDPQDAGAARRPGPDETRVMRTQPRASEQPAPSQPPRPAPAPRPAPTPSTPRAPRSGRRWFRLRPRLLLAIPVVWLAFLVVVPLIAWGQVDNVKWEPKGDRPGDQPGTTYLLVGSDSRGDLSEAERKRLGTGGDVGQRTDTIMLLHTGSGPNLLMSIPRDSIVDVPGRGTGKINGAYAFGGPKLLTRTIEDATGIRIDDYVEIGMGGLAGVVDAVGGVEVCPEFRMKDPQANLNIKKGCQEVDGATALGYARSRKTDPRFGDITRAKHQREVVSAVGSKVLSPWTFLNPVRYWNLNNSVPGFFGFGEGTGPIDAAKWALAMTRVDGDAGLTCGVPIADLAVHWDDERSKQMFDAIISDQTDDLPKGLCTPTGLPKSVTG